MPKTRLIQTDHFYILPCGRRFQSIIKNPKILELHRKACLKCSISEIKNGKMKENIMI